VSAEEKWVGAAIVWRVRWGAGVAAEAGVAASVRAARERAARERAARERARQGAAGERRVILGAVVPSAWSTLKGTGRARSVAKMAGFGVEAP
jgi:hypothetical protein